MQNSVFFSFQEGVHNVTVVAWNQVQNATEALVTFEIVGQVRGIEIDDYNEITPKDELKWFYLDFESIGAGTCIFMDFQDGITQTFGDENYCEEWAPDVEYVPGVEMTLPVIITHTYL